MAVTLGKSPVIMTEAGDFIDGNWKVTVVRCVTGSSGAFVLKDRSGGRDILRTRALQAADSEESGAIDYWIDGAYVDQIPANSFIYIYYE